jgi:long-chain acyl-CoA synthetase
MNLAAMIEGHASSAPALIVADSAGRAPGLTAGDSAGRAPGLTAGEGVVTYGELRHRVAVLRARLLESAVQPDDRVALISGNHPAFVVGYLAILGVGAVAVPLNPASPAPEIQREIGTVRAGVAVVGPQAENRASALAEAGIRQVLAAEAPAGEPQQEPAIVERGPDDLAVLMFTSGTAGAPKAAQLSHGNLLANLDQVQRHPGRATQADDVCLCVLPAFHILGLNVIIGLALHHGASIVLVDRFDAAGSLDAIAGHGVTLVAGVPTMFAAWAALPPSVDLREAWSTVRLATSGAAPLSDEVARAFAGRAGIDIHQGYGLTEASPVVTASLLDQPPRYGSIGVPLPGVEVRLVDEEGEDALPGDQGELWVRGPNVFSGYWEDPEATAVALGADGWLRTGDVAVAGDAGQLYLVDRAKDLIIVSGFNVYPAEVEEVLLEDPDVVGAAVIGRPDPDTGETVTAQVVARDPSAPPDPAALIAACRARLARYKCPTEVSVVPSLPLGLGGKLLRRAVREGPELG